MGRASGKSQAAGTAMVTEASGFEMFGRRGRARDNTLLARRPQDEAKHELWELAAALRAGQPAAALSALSGRAALIEDAPLLAELRRRLQRWTVTDTMSRWYQVSAEFMANAGLRSSASLVSGWEDGIWCIHICPDGRDIVTTLLGEPPSPWPSTVCGQSTAGMIRVDTARWIKDGPARCRRCARVADRYSDCQLQSARRPLGKQHEQVAAQLHDTATALLAEICAGQNIGLERLRAQMDETYRPALLAAAAAAAADKPGSVLDEIWKALSSAQRAQLAGQTLNIEHLHNPAVWQGGYSLLLPVSADDRPSNSSGGVRSKQMRRDIAEWATHAAGAPVRATSGPSHWDSRGRRRER